MWSSIVLFVHVTGAIGLFSVNSLVVLASLITFVVLAVLNNALNGRRMGAMRRNSTRRCAIRCYGWA